MSDAKKTEVKEVPTEPVESKLRDTVDQLVANIDDKFDLPGFLKPVVSYLDNYPWLLALLTLMFFLIIAKLVEWFVGGVVKKATSHTKTQVDDKIVSYLRSPIFWSVALFGFLVSVSLLGVSANLRGFLIAVVITVLLLMWMRFGLRVSKLLLAVVSQNAEKLSLVRPQTLPLFTNLSYLAIIATAVYFIFQVWSIDMTAWLASAGIVGIAVGFAAKDTLANLFSGVFIMADSPYKIGDYVVLDDGTGLRGEVTQIGIRSTRVLTRNDVEVTIPNSIMGNSKVINQSGGPHLKMRIKVAVGVAYGSDIDKVRSVLQGVAEESSHVCQTPVPRVRFRTFGASSLDFELMAWIDNPALRGRVLDSMNSTIYKRFLDESIEIPFTKQDIYIKELPQYDSAQKKVPDIKEC